MIDYSRELQLHDIHLAWEINYANICSFIYIYIYIYIYSYFTLFIFLCLFIYLFYLPLLPMPSLIPYSTLHGQEIELKII
ncbi:unnamed protein product [Coffea canephora]|uniref:Uncharacterized protein n=1 Tax=Coffea canephora TaxID=49390 RepID=A0A068UWT1_COFCA|nr:unnamed protein product [Coffea canephora]